MLSMRYPIPTSKASKGEGSVQAQAHGAFIPEGRWMWPATPLTHRQIMVSYNKSHRQWRYAALQERAKWELRQKGVKTNSNLVKCCPGSGEGGSLNCPLKPDEPAPRSGAVPPSCGESAESSWPHLHKRLQPHVRRRARRRNTVSTTATAPPNGTTPTRTSARPLNRSSSCSSVPTIACTTRQTAGCEARPPSRSSPSSASSR